MLVRLEQCKSRHQILQKTASSLPVVVGVNGDVPFEVTSGVIKKEPLTGILHNLQQYQYQANNGTGLEFQPQRCELKVCSFF